MLTSKQKKEKQSRKNIPEFRPIFFFFFFFLGGGSTPVSYAYEYPNVGIVSAIEIS